MRADDDEQAAPDRRQRRRSGRSRHRRGRWRRSARSARRSAVPRARRRAGRAAIVSRSPIVSASGTTTAGSAPRAASTSAARTRSAPSGAANLVEGDLDAVRCREVAGGPLVGPVDEPRRRVGEVAVARELGLLERDPAAVAYEPVAAVAGDPPSRGQRRHQQQRRRRAGTEDVAHRGVSGSRCARRVLSPRRTRRGLGAAGLGGGGRVADDGVGAVCVECAAVCEQVKCRWLLAQRRLDQPRPPRQQERHVGLALGPGRVVVDDEQRRRGAAAVMSRPRARWPRRGSCPPARSPPGAHRARG